MDKYNNTEIYKNYKIVIINDRNSYWQKKC